MSSHTTATVPKTETLSADNGSEAQNGKTKKKSAVTTDRIIKRLVAENTLFYDGDAWLRGAESQ